VLFVGFVVGRNIGCWLFGCWFCDGGEMAEEEAWGSEFALIPS
jgi:hypothetical protein